MKTPKDVPLDGPEINPSHLLSKSIVITLFCLSLCIAIPSTDRAYDLPQMTALLALGFFLWTRQFAKQFDKQTGLTCLAVAGVGAFVANSLEIKEILVLPILFAAMLILFATLTARERTLISWGIVSVAAIQVALVLISYTLGSLDQLGLHQLNSVPVGSVGNPDFLATIIAAGIFLLLQTQASKHFKFSMLVFLFVGLLLTKSRGTIALVFLLIAWEWIPKWATLSTGAVLISAIGIFWEKFAGRIQLWWVSIIAFLERPLSGHGLESFDSVYFNTNLSLMSENESFRSTFGPWSSQVTDAHNLILQYAVELGFIGAAAAAIFIGTIVFASKSREPAYTRIILMLAAKCLYTVVLISVQSVSLLTLSLSGGTAEKSRRTVDPKFMALSLFLLLIVSSSILQAVLNSRDIYKSMNYLTIGLPERARIHLDNILKRNPEHTDALIAKSYSYLQQGQCSHSSLYAIQATRLRQNMDTYKRAGHILFECEFYREAVELLNLLHIVFPEHRTTTMKLAWSHYYLGEYPEAKKLAQNVLFIKPRRVSFSDERNLEEAKELIETLDRH